MPGKKANGASKRGGENSNKGESKGSSKQGDTTEQKASAARKGGKKAASKR